MRYKKPRIATLDEVIISRDGEYAVIEFREQGISGMNLQLGPKVIWIPLQTATASIVHEELRPCTPGIEVF